MNVTDDLHRALNRVFWNAQRRTAVRPPGRVENDVISRVDDLLHRGAYAEARDLVEAEECLDSDPTALQALALALIGLEKQEKAVEALAKSVAYLTKQLSGVYANLSVAQFERGELDNALAAAYRSRDYHHTWWLPWVNLVMIYGAKRDAKAIETEIQAMKAAWPAWHEDEGLQERVKTDATLRFLRDTKELRDLFSDWLPVR